MSKGEVYQYLKDHIYYDELYDKFTIGECQRLENNPYPGDISKVKGKEKKVANLKRETFLKLVMPVLMVFLKAERAAKKSGAISEWMERDKAKDKKISDAIEPQGVRCLGCSSTLKNCISRDLMDNHQGKEEILFMFECDKCGKRRSYWENGKEWEYKQTCVKCKAEVQASKINKGNTIITKYICSKCGYVETDVFDLDSNSDQVDPNFEADRKKYCISELEGRETMMQAEEMKKFVDEWKDKDKNKKLYEAADNIKKITISELQNLLDPIIENSGYAKLEFEKPEIEKNVILEFSLQDIKSGRDKNNSTYNLQRLLKKTLEDTNWRLMSDGVNYRLGFLTGRLKGFESEEDILELVSKNKKFRIS